MQIENSPERQFNTAWANSDNTIYFKILCNGDVNGFIKTEYGINDVNFVIGAQQGEIIVYPLNVKVNNENNIITYNFSDRIEWWCADFYSPDEFVVTVKESTYFDVGDTFVFHKVDNTNIEAWYD